MAQQISDLLHGCTLFQQVSCTRMPEAVRTAPTASDACRLHSPTRDFPESATSDRPVWWLQRQEQIPARGPWPRLLDVCQDGIAYFTLQRILLSASAFRVIHRERLRAPVEITQQKTRYLAAAQSVQGQKEQNGFGAQRGRIV
ncbi:MAG: hypothetical protein WBQ94_09570, partial [Terracidiphilus sp.]